MCSLINVNLTTFDDVVFNTTEIWKDNCWTLLAADCSNQASLSLFIKAFSDDSFAIKIFSGNDVIEYNPQGNTEQIMVVNRDNKFKLNALDNKETTLLSTLTPIK